MFCANNRFKISVSVSQLLQNLPLLLERVLLCSLQIIALKLICHFRSCYKICPCYQKVKIYNTVNMITISLLFSPYRLFSKTEILSSSASAYSTSVQSRRSTPNETNDCLSRYYKRPSSFIRTSLIFFKIVSQMEMHL